MIKKITSLLVLILTATWAYGQTLTVTATPTSPLCNNGTNGSVSVAVSGCAGPYSYTVTPGNITGSSPTSPFVISNLGSGNYTINVTTAGGGSGPIFTDDFEGANNWTLNTAIGTQGGSANKWIINAASAYDGSCDAGAGNKSMHITCTSICSLIGNSALYDESGAANATDKFTFTTNNISTVGRTNLQLKFAWQCEGVQGDDYGNVRYSINGGTSWVDLPAEYSASSSWTCATVSLPQACENITTLKLGFRWRNSGDGIGTDPPFNIDHVVLDGAGGGSGGCTGSTTFALNNPAAYVPTTNVNGNVSICTGSNIQLIATSGTGCVWSNGTSTFPGSSYTATTAGTYTVTCNNPSNCSGTSAPIVVSVGSTFTPTTNITGAQSICNGDQLQIIATSGQNCTWNTVPSQTAQSITVSGPGSYACTCQDQGGQCTGTSAAVNVSIAPPPVGGFSYEQTANYILNLYSTSTGGETFDWIFDNAPFTDSGDTVTHSFPSQGTYPVTLIVSSDCGTDTVVVNVVVLKVGIDETNVFSKFDLFPNPAQNEAMLQLTALKPFVGSVKIVTPMGQIVSDEVVKFSSSLSKTIDLRNLANGIYSIVVTTEGKNFARRLVVNN